MIYILEDDKNIRELVAYTLINSGFDVKGFETPSLFWSACNEFLPKLILLDIMLPEEDGISILKKLRQNDLTNKIPIIMLTAKDSEYDKILGFENGADDYVSKPFGIIELLARIKALLRRIENIDNNEEINNDKLYAIGDLNLYLNRYKVVANSKEVILTKKEFDMLYYLMKNKNIVLTREQLLNKVWGYDFDGENRTVDVHIRTLRKKLGECGKYIETIRGIGYKISEK